MSQKTKKYFVLSILFIFPIVIYLFFASGKNNFAFLPVLTEGVNEIKKWETLSGKPIQFENQISILGFWGQDLLKKRGDALNLNQKIYKRFYQFKDFQFVMVLENDQQNQVNILKKELQEGVGTDLVSGDLFSSLEEIQDLFDSLGTNLNLSEGKVPLMFSLLIKN